MWLLDIAWRALIQKGTEKFLKETETGKKIVKAITPTNKPQTPQGEGLSFWGSLQQPSAQYQRSMEENRKSAELLNQANNYAGNNEEIKKAGLEFSTPSLSFDDIISKSSFYMLPWTLDSRKAQEFRDAIIGTAKWDNTSEALIKSKVSTPTIEDFKFFRRRVEEAKSTLWDMEGRFDAFTTGQAKWIPFGSKVVDTLSKWAGYIGWWVAEWSFDAERMPSFLEREQAKAEKESEWTYDTRGWYRLVGTIQWGLSGYGAFWKVVDKVLLWAKVPAWVAPIQNALRQSYTTNPTLFNITSNSAQEAIEYGVRKWIGDEDYSAKDFALWLVLWGVASKIFSKTSTHAFDWVTQKDLNKIEVAMNEAKKMNPEATGKDLFDSISELKLSDWLTVGERKNSFIQATGGKLQEIISTTPDAVSNFFRSTWTNITTWASKKITNMLDDVNEAIATLKWTSENIWTIWAKETKDIRLFKSEVLSELWNSTTITMKDAEEVLRRKAKEYGIQLKSATHKIDLLDEAEEVIVREGSQIHNLANPQTIRNFQTTYLGKEDFDIDRVYKLQDEVDKLSLMKASAKRLTTIEENNKAIKELLSQAWVKSVKELENIRFRIDDSEISKLAKEARTSKIATRVTNSEKDAIRTKLINETRKLESDAEKIIVKMGKTKSTTNSGDFAKVIQFTQLKNGIENGDYRKTLKSFVEVNSAALKWDISEAVELSGWKVFDATERTMKKLKLTPEMVDKYARENWFDGYKIDGEFKLLNTEKSIIPKKQASLDVDNELIEEARKYKSADEFLKAQWEILYRWWVSEWTSFTTQKRIAEDFAKYRWWTVKEYIISKNAKIADYNDFPDRVYKNTDNFEMWLDAKKDKLSFMENELESEFQRVTKWAKQNWYDAINLPVEDELRIINKWVIIEKQAIMEIYESSKQFKPPQSSLTLSTNKFKWIDATKYWINWKELTKQRIRNDIDLITEEANKQMDWKFHLSDDEEASILVKWWNTLMLKNGSWLNYVDSYKRVFERVFGSDSHTMRVVFDRVDSARWDWAKESIEFKGTATKLAFDAGLKDEQTQRKFMIAMTARQWWVDDRIIRSDNIRIDKEGKIWDSNVDTTFFMGKSKVPTTTRPLDSNDIAQIIKEVEKNPKMKWLIQFLDNKFYDGAIRLNRQLYQDTGKLIPTENRYFPLFYNNANYFKTWEEARDSLKQMFSSHIQQWFLQARKSAPSNFSLDIDFANVINSYANRQLYFLHMKSPVMNAKRAVSWANRWIGRTIDWDFWVLDNGEIELNDISLEGTPVLSPKMKDYFDKYITRVENRWVIPTSHFAPTQLLQSVATHLTIAWNPWSALAQPFSIIDSMANTWVKNVGKWMYTTFKDFLKWGNRSAFKYSWVLLERQTEHIAWLAWWFLRNHDLSELSSWRITDGLMNKVNEVWLRLMRRMDWEVSYSVWHGYLYDYVQKNFPEIKISTNVDDIRRQMNDDVAFNRAVEYADSEMTSVMGWGSAFTHWSQIQELWVFYKAWTMIQRTFINRMLFLNHNLSQWAKGWLTVPTTLMVLWLGHWAETEREYLRQMWYEWTGKKEDKSKWDENHFAELAITNPSLQYDNVFSKWIVSLVSNLNKLSGWDWNISPSTIIWARSFVNFVGNNLWNPQSGYEVKSNFKWVSTMYDKYQKWEYPTDERMKIALTEAVAKAILPNFGRDWIDLLHSYLYDETLWKTEEDNYQLSKTLKDNPNKRELVNQMDLKAQWEFADKARTAYQEKKTVTESHAEENARKDSLKTILQKKIGAKPSKDEFATFAKENKQLFIDAWIDTNEEAKNFYNSLSKTDVGKQRTDEYSFYYWANSEVIYNHFVKKFVDAKDRKWYEDMVDELYIQWVILDKDAFNKKVAKIVKNKQQAK